MTVKLESNSCIEFVNIPNFGAGNVWKYAGWKFLVAMDVLFCVFVMY